MKAKHAILAGVFSLALTLALVMWVAARFPAVASYVTLVVFSVIGNLT